LCCRPLRSPFSYELLERSLDGRIDIPAEPLIQVTDAVPEPLGALGRLHQVNEGVPLGIGRRDQRAKEDGE
jgi:hypothetical protein